MNIAYAMPYSKLFAVVCRDIHPIVNLYKKYAPKKSLYHKVSGLSRKICIVSISIILFYLFIFE